MSAIWERLLVELERDEDAELTAIFDQLGLIEPAPELLDDKVISRARSCVESRGVGLDEELMKDENAKLSPSLSALGLIEEPPRSLDAAVLAQARRAANAVAEPKIAARTGLAAAGLAAAFWLRDNTFAAVTVALAATTLILTTAIEKNTPPAAELAAFQPMRAGETRWAGTDEPELPRFSESGDSYPVQTSTVERTIAEALAGGGDIEKVRADGTIEAGKKKRFVIRSLELDGALAESRARLVLAGASAKAAACTHTPSSWKLAIDLEGAKTRIHVEGGIQEERLCVKRALLGAEWPISSGKTEIRALIDLYPK